MASLLPALAFLAGLALIIAGVWMVYPPAGVIAAGLLACVAALGWEWRPRKPPVPAADGPAQ